VAVPRPAAAPENEVVFPATRGKQTAGDTGGSGNAGSDLTDILSVSRPGSEKSSLLSETGRVFSHITGSYRSRDYREFEAGIMNTIVRQARFLFVNRQSSATVVLEPPNLGRLKLDIVTENSKITGKILVESREVQEIIRMNISDLRHNLAQNGFMIESFDVQVGHNGGTDAWARREDMESIASLMRNSNEEKNGIRQEAPDSGEMLRRNTVRSPGSIDLWI
jgi:flagellar hook-length control protein FliK